MHSTNQRPAAVSVPRSAWWHEYFAPNQRCLTFGTARAELLKRQKPIRPMCAVWQPTSARAVAKWGSILQWTDACCRIAHDRAISHAQCLLPTSRQDADPVRRTKNASLKTSWRTILRSNWNRALWIVIFLRYPADHPPLCTAFGAHCSSVRWCQLRNPNPHGRLPTAEIAPAGNIHGLMDDIGGCWWFEIVFRCLFCVYPAKGAQDLFAFEDLASGCAGSLRWKLLFSCGPINTSYISRMIDATVELSWWRVSAG